MSLHRRIAKSLGYELIRFNKSDSLNSNLRRLFATSEFHLVLDCGACFGKFARACRGAGYSGPILSFEPAPLPFAKLAGKAHLDVNWEALQIGVGLKNETATLNLHPHHFMSSIYEPRSEPVAGTVTIQIRRLEDILDEREVPKDAPLFLKSDTQGNDLNVIEGLGTRLAQVRAIMVEMSVMPLYHGPPSHWDAMLYFKERGFEPFAFASVSRDKSGGLIEYDAIFRRPL